MSSSPDLARLVFQPVTRDNWADFEALFGGPGGPRHCWCMVWRATPEEGRGTSGAVRHGQMRRRVVEDAVEIGLLGYLDGRPVAWVSIAPRDTYRRLNGPDAGPGANIWSLACMFTLRRLRGHGIAHRLIAAAIAHAKSRGAAIVEAYPVAPDAPSYRFMGFVPAFENAGFAHLGMTGRRRHVMRLAV